MTSSRPSSPGDALRSGRRVWIRRARRSDAAEMVALARDNVRKLRPWVSPPTREPAYLTWWRARRPPRNELLLVCRRDDGAIVGNFNISEIVRGVFQCGFLGYWIGAAYQGQGYGREGMQLVLRYAFGDLGLHRVEANIQPGNAGSIALVRSLGFTREGLSPRYLKIGGRWRDHERWALLADARRR